MFLFYSYFLSNVVTCLQQKLLFLLIILYYKRYRTIYFSTSLEEYKVIYPDGRSNYITKDDFSWCSVHFFVSKFLKEIQIIVISIFWIWTSKPQNVLNLSFFFFSISTLQFLQSFYSDKKSVMTFYFFHQQNAKYDAVLKTEI